MSKSTPGVRYAEVERETKETRVQIVLDLDGGQRRDINTGIPFFDHMLDQLAFHAHINVGISAEGDLAVDDHHTVEDVGIVLGQAIRHALDGGEHIARFSSNHTAMDDALVLTALDISGRGKLFFEAEFTREKVGGLATECVREFFGTVAANAGITLHLRKICGINDHHLCEAMFKGFGLALSQATHIVEGKGVRSTKGRIG